MGLRYRKRIKLGKFLNLNVSKSGIGWSAGRPGMRIGKSSRGTSYTSVGIPGTGISWWKSFGRKK